MLSKKALVLITAENEVEALVEFAKVFKKKYGIEAEGLYVKDILKYEIFPIAVEGIGINVGANYAFKEYKELEEKTFRHIRELTAPDFSNVYSREGETVEIALEELKNMIC